MARPKIAFTYDPYDVPTKQLLFFEVYKTLFEITDSTEEDIFFDRFVKLRKSQMGTELNLFLSNLQSKDLIVHNPALFKFQFSMKSADESDDGTDAEQHLNNLVMDYVIMGGNCQGFRPRKDKDITIKENLPTICNILDIPTTEVINAAALLEGSFDYNNAMDRLKSWQDGSYLKYSEDANGRFNWYFPRAPLDELIKNIKDINPSEISNFIVTNRIETPHPKYASHYRAFSFFNGKKTHILSAVLYYNLYDKYSVHGDREGVIPLTGKHRGRPKTKKEKELIKAHNLTELELPSQVADIIETAGRYSARTGSAIISSEILEDQDHNYYLMDINAIPALVAITATEFNKAHGDIQSHEKAAQMIVNCYK